MFGNNLKIAFRNIIKHSGFSVINISGLAIGIACSVLIFLFVKSEFEFDTFHDNSDRIYRLIIKANVGGTPIHQTYSSAITFKTLLADFPEFETGVKFLKLGNTPITVGEQNFTETRIYAVDSTFFKVFTFPLVLGNIENQLIKPNTVIISESTAIKYFGTTDALGKLITTYGDNESEPDVFEVTGVAKDVPVSSHFHFDLLVSTDNFPSYINSTGWTNNNFIAYFVLKEGVDVSELNNKLKEFTRKYMGGEKFDAFISKGNSWDYILQPMLSIHLTSDLNGEFETNGNQTYVYIFLIVGIFVLLIACINFMNLATAKSSLRAREIGIRKVVGSTRSRLMTQFLSEAILTSFLALLIGIIIVELLLPSYCNLIGRQLSIDYFSNTYVIPILLLLAFIVGILSGAYPAFILSSYIPVQVLRGQVASTSGKSKVRSGLIIFQFSIAIFLFISTITVFYQLKYLSSVKLGFDKDQVLVVKNPGTLRNVDFFKNEVSRLDEVIGVTGSNTLPGKSFNNIGFGAEDVEEHFTLNICVCDYNFDKTMKLQIEKGRFFSKEFKSDSLAVVINRKTASLLGWDESLGKKLNNWSNNQGIFTVIGVVEDYHYESLHSEIRPMALFLSGGYYTSTEKYLSIRLNTKNLSETLAGIKNIWEETAPGKPFEYSFLDEDYDKLYMNELQTGKLFTIFSLLAIFIACLGLFGLAAFIAERKAREIGIRKVLGAGIPGLVNKLNLNFIKWVLAANIIAWPAAWYIMKAWLQNFAYRIDMNIWMFIASGSMALIIAVVTVSYQSIKSAMLNPVDVLRNE